ncbi:MAG: phosphoribosylanthranilate isomerase [Acidimicrobiales bacterium]|nr:phosphoribosylanthranilate isomerase [Hyphomonadaceae bacterium]RZV43924.1 MAG: phosphoribosylanthranilate isomerase [Acidimicrobiales bacterium]
MNSPDIKFCGLTRPQDVESAIALGANYLGFIIECQSPRRLSVTDAARLAKPASGLAARVAVTVDADDALIASIIEKISPDAVQLHGDESPDRLRDLKTQYSVKLIKALNISNPKDLEHAHFFADVADFLLLDAKPPKGDKQRGGHGNSFDWNLLKNFKTKAPLIIAGGLSSKTIGLAQKMTKAHIFDVSSGIETAPGIKDATLMTEFMKAARQE